MLFRASGGLIYHLRALRSSSSWVGFREAIHEWLSRWSSGSGQELILVGPSGGYTLTSEWLKQFRKVLAYDLDPLAPWFFRRRHAGAQIQFERRDLFWVDGRLSTKPLAEVLEAHPHAKILFSNVLGQVLLEGKASEREWQSFLSRLRLLLNGRDWASYHDLFTHERGHIIDHLMEGEWKDELPQQNFEWNLTPKSRHVIEGIHSPQR